MTTTTRVFADGRTKETKRWEWKERVPSAPAKTVRSHRDERDERDYDAHECGENECEQRSKRPKILVNVSCIIQ